jgi:hypothetical protein
MAPRMAGDIRLTFYNSPLVHETIQHRRRKSYTRFLDQGVLILTIDLCKPCEGNFFGSSVNGLKTVAKQKLGVTFQLMVQHIAVLYCK